MRLNGQTAQIEGGQVHIPEEAPWLYAFLGEVLAFPSSEFTDQVDSLSQALRDLRNQTGRHGERTRPNPKRPAGCPRTRRSGREERPEGHRRSGYQPISGLYYRRGYI